MCGTQGLTINHCQPVCWNLARLYECCIHIPWINPEPELHSVSMYCIGKISEPMWELLRIPVVIAEPLRPIIHAGNDRCTFVPGGIVIKDIESDSPCQFEFLENRLFAVLFGEPNAIGDQRSVW